MWCSMVKPLVDFGAWELGQDVALDQEIESGTRHGRTGNLDAIHVDADFSSFCLDADGDLDQVLAFQDLVHEVIGGAIPGSIELEEVDHRGGRAGTIPQVDAGVLHGFGSNRESLCRKVGVEFAVRQKDPVAGPGLILHNVVHLFLDRLEIVGEQEKQKSAKKLHDRETSIPGSGLPRKASISPRHLRRISSDRLSRIANANNPGHNCMDEGT